MTDELTEELTMDEVLAYTWLSGCSRLNRRSQKFLVEAFGGAQGVFEASDEEITGCLEVYGAGLGQRRSHNILPGRDVAEAKRCLSLAASMGSSVLHYKDPAYPNMLRALPDSPMVLYALGDVSLLGASSVAVVGTRRASPYGRWAAYEISARIASCGTPVVSGLAEGIDAEAHKGCLEGGAGTVAVLGTGIGHCFPASNRTLFRTIREQGLLLSEFRPDDKGFASYFPLRNRIISGIARAVVVVEGAEKSGSMITAGHALEQGKDVFAVPGNINQPHSAGVNRLIYDGAYPIMDLDTVPRMLGLATRRQQTILHSLSKEEAFIYEIVREAGMLSRQELCERAGMEASQVASLATILELKGLLSGRGTKIEVAK